jgi:IS30 family transposase
MSCDTQLTQGQRYQMEAHCKVGHNQTMTANVLTVHKSTISRELRRKRYGKQDRRGRIPNRISIEERPAIVNSKSRIGDWEGDTIIGKEAIKV